MGAFSQARVKAIIHIIKAREFFVVTDTACIAGAGDRFIEEFVPSVYQRVTDINLKHKAKYTPKARVGKETVIRDAS